MEVRLLLLCENGIIEQSLESLIVERQGNASSNKISVYVPN